MIIRRNLNIKTISRVKNNIIAFDFIIQVMDTTSNEPKVFVDTVFVASNWHAICID